MFDEIDDEHVPMSLDLSIDVDPTPVQDPKFRAGDTFDVPWKSIEKQLKFQSRTGENLGRGWSCSPVTIQVPTADKSDAGRRLHPNGRAFTIPEFYHRSIVSVMDAVFGKDPASTRFHHVPFRQFWSPFNSSWRRETVFGELYSSAAFIKAHEDLQSSPLVPGCTLPRVISAMMLGSDATHLTQFGSAQLWPIYLWWGNQSKYERCMPSIAACHCVAYLEKLPQSIMEFLEEHHKGRGKKKNDALLAHLRRELTHESLKLLFEDPDFKDAYAHGRVIVGADGVARRHFPRIFTYSADYPEKVMLATIRDMGGCPCPRCLVKKADLDLLGTAADMKTRTENKRCDGPERQRWVGAARTLLYKVGLALGNDKIEALLKPHSWVPTQNAFSWLTSLNDPDICQLLVVDIMHEYELGVWKALFAHLIRILHTQGQDTVNELNRRYRDTPTFSSSTIRRFPTCVSEMSRMTAQDFEDLLVCAIPCFDRLFPEAVDTEISQLLFRAAEWHALAKLRMHTDSTLVLLHNATIRLGTALRHFRDVVCTQFDTTETPSEVAKRQRAVARAVAEGRTTSLSTAGARRPKAYNLNTPKLHFLGDYVPQIQWVGTTDSYSTESGERQHRTQKDRFQRTSKRDFTVQMVGLNNLHEALQQTSQSTSTQGQQKSRSRPTHDEADIVGDRVQHHLIAEDQSNTLLYGDWIRGNSSDMALEGFLPKLLRACAEGLLQRPENKGRLPLDAALDGVALERQRLYEHATFRVNYTTYDIRRLQDTINVNSGKCDVMLLSSDDIHPFRYARVLRVFHALVTHPILAPRPVRVELLWVRWFQNVKPFDAAWDRKELQTVQFVHATEDDAFGFVNPAQVLRACHVIPSFADGRTKDLLGPSLFRPPEGDWAAFYVAEFADRDLHMRHLGLGIGHRDPPAKIEPEPDSLSPPAAAPAAAAAAAPAPAPEQPAPVPTAAAEAAAPTTAVPSATDGRSAATQPEPAADDNGAGDEEPEEESYEEKDGDGTDIDDLPDDLEDDNLDVDNRGEDEE
ncbi:hypothetical protein EXIGLDRAFT_712500 [Exidia glandulosa HHB12029]|uniref:Uncharacterized protein n=1 Tax=Exidia glandulosa HHB12029 TaxID=1314781 RepID=A0A165MFH0_EXIGL|nr:hypothetical protein EXIGLDRAFT_712500 [Exidia glandulosa HHB12029]